MHVLLPPEHGHLLPAADLPPGFFTRLAALHSKEGGWEAVEWAVLRMPLLLRRFASLVAVLNEAYKQPLPPWGPSVLPIPVAQFAVRRATVTPLRVLYSAPSPLPSNAIMRNFLQEGRQDPGKILIVHFRDEHGGFIHGNESLFLARVQQVLEGGYNPSVP